MLGIFDSKILQVCWVWVFLSGCSADRYRERADAETLAVLFKKTGSVENVEDESIVLSSNQELWAASSYTKSATGKQADFLGKDQGEKEKSARVLTLDRALETAITYNRQYLLEKEAVFLESLNLTLVQHRLSPIFGGQADVVRRSDSRGAVAQAGLTDLVATNTFARSQTMTFDRLYRTGARLTADFTQDFLNFLSGNRDINNSALAVTLVQPLLQGGGTKATLEVITQADRDVLYALRDFANFRREFIVDLVTDYYRVLEARDNVINSHLAYEGFVKNVMREEALAEEDRRTQAQLGQLKQALLLSESRWLSSIRDYQTGLDQFKLTLGIPVEENIVLADSELERLKILSPEVTREEAVKIAVVTRPDLATSADRINDAERKIDVAENQLKAGLALEVDYQAISEPGDLTPDLNFDRRNISSRLDLDLPLDRKAERNVYRAAWITKDLRERQHEENVDRVRLQIYDDWRALELAEKNYEIALKAIDLARRRLEEQFLLAELGKGEARDLVDAQNDLVNAQNQRTSSLITHTVARLRLWRDMGILYIEGDGSWKKKLEREAKVTAVKVSQQ